MTEPTERDRSIVKAMTFRDPGLYSRPEQQVERMAEYLSAYREECVKQERERVLAALEELRIAWHDRSLRDHRCPSYESCIECHVNYCFEDRAEDLAALIAKLRA